MVFLSLASSYLPNKHAQLWQGHRAESLSSLSSVLPPCFCPTQGDDSMNGPPTEEEIGKAERFLPFIKTLELVEWLKW